MIKSICEKLEFPVEATDYLQDCFDKIMSSNSAKKVLDDSVLACFDGVQTYVDGAISIADMLSIREESVNMVLMLVCAARLKEVYRSKGLSEDLYLETMQDLRYKLLECQKVHGIWGTFVPYWFHRFFLCERFQIGRLQYEEVPFTYADEAGFLKKGDKVLNCHIPSGGKLSEELVIDSLKRAYQFFGEYVVDGVLPVVCNSWLLYEPLDEVFKDSRNIMSFRAMFTVLQNKKDEKNEDFWRVFNTEYRADGLADIIAETRLQQRVKDFLLQGNCLGAGKALLLFDGEKVIK